MKPSVLLSRIAVFSFFVSATVSSQQLELQPVERLPTPVMDPASDDAELAIKRFSVPKGLQVKLWAAEPMLANPVAIDFDEKGRLFVSETYRYRTSVLDIRDYMGMLERDLANRTIEDRAKMQHDVFGAHAKDLAIEGEVVRLVEDKDHDGKADSSRVFADGFNGELDGIASGVLARHGKVWFTDIPSLWRLDEQPDGSVKKNELLRGFGVRFNFTGHDFHGLALGHDGKLYFSIGDRGAHVTAPDGSTIDFPDEGAVYRSNPDGTELEVVHRGLRNPQELVFDEHGNLFTGDNDSDQSDQERLVYLVEGGDSGWRIGYQHAPLGHGGPWIREGLWKPRFPGRPAYLLPPICNIEDGPSGLTYYPGTGLTKEYAGHFFITHFKGSIARSGIQTYTIRQDGATFVPTSSQQFIGGVLPTDVTFGPDGVLYLADWVDGWPKSQKGRIYGITPVKPDPADAAESAALAQLLAEGFKQRSDDALVKLLSHPDRRARLEAQLELASRGAKSAPLFVKVAQGKGGVTPLARLHAVWGLTQLGRSTGKADPLLAKLLGDADGEVRAQAAKSLGDLGQAKAVPALIKLLGDAEPRARFFAAQSLGKLEDAKATAPLLALLRTNADKDAYLRFAAAHALAKIGANDTLRAAAKDPSAAVRLGVLLAYRELADADIAQFLKDSDPYLAHEAAEAINDVPIAGAMEALARSLADAPADDQAFVVRAINANYRVAPALIAGQSPAVKLAAYALNDKATPEMRAEALTQLGLWGTVPARDRVVGVYRPMPARDGKPAADALASVLPKLLESAPEGVQLAAIQAVKSLGMKNAGDTLAAAVANTKAPESVRAAALEQLDAIDEHVALEVADVAQKSEAPGLRLAALQIVARRAPERALPVIRQFVATGSEAEQRAAFQALAKLDRPEAPKLLVGAIDQLATGKVQPGAQVELIEAAEKSTVPAVRARWAKQLAAWEGSGNALAPFSFALAGGDPRRGAGVFYDNAVLPCVRCHKVGGEGGDAGPDLSLIGKKPVEYLLESVVKPSAHIAPGFDIVTFQLKDGSTETGSVASESATAIALKRADGTTLDIDPKQVKKRTVAPSSMPEIYGQVLSRNDLRNLIAFLDVLERPLPGQSDEKFGETQPRAMAPVTLPGKEGGHP
jgi:quinoprotein glucose dehydrogenase